MNHTPAPWEVTTSAGTYKGHIIGADGTMVVSDLEDYDNEVSLQTLEANASLIATAPDLLDSLQDCLEQINQMAPMFDDSDIAIQNCIDNAEAAIHKATGEAA